MATRQLPKLDFPEAERAVVIVLYSPTTGEIVHVHSCSADEDSEMPSVAELERHARESAEIHDRGAGPSTALLHLSGRDFDLNAKLKVDPKTRKLARVTTRAPQKAAAKKTVAKKAKR